MSSWHKFRCPDSRGTAAEDCRREGCIRHRLTLAHQDRPKPHATRARLPETVGRSGAGHRAKRHHRSYQGHRRWALSSTFVALSQQRSTAGNLGQPLWRCHSTEAKQAVMTGEFMAKVLMPRQRWNSGRGLPPRGVYPTPSHSGAPGPPETTCHQSQVANDGWAFRGGSEGKTLSQAGVIRGTVGGPYHPPLWRCHSREAKQAIFDRGARYIYVGYSRWALASTFAELSQHGSKVGSRKRYAHGKCSVHGYV